MAANATRTISVEHSENYNTCVIFWDIENGAVNCGYKRSMKIA